MEEFEQHLQSLWQQGGRDVAVSFLRRAVTPQTPLVELLAALQFDAVEPHLGEITLKDVLPGRQAAHAAPAAPAAAAPAARAPAPTAKKVRGRRRRRTPDELRAIGEAIEQMLVDEPGSLNTTQIVSALQKDGHEFDTMRVNTMLRGMQKDELVADLGGKPKGWRATPKLRGQRTKSKD